MKRLALAILITSPAVVVYLITSVGGREDGRSPRVDSRPVAAEDLLARAYAERLDQRLADAEERIARLRREASRRR